MSEQERNKEGNSNNQNSAQQPNTGTEKSTVPFRITGNWEQQSTQLKNQYSELTDSDLNFRPGQESQLVNQIGTKLNKSQDEVINILNQSNESDRSNESNDPDRFTV